MKKSPSNLAVSVHGRLLARSRAEGVPFDDLLQYYVMERFLYRLSRSKHAKLFVLKGALMLRLWGGTLPRATKDIDLAKTKPTSVERLLEIFRNCLEEPVEEDGLSFDTNSLRGSEIRIASDYQGVRLKLTARLQKAVIRLQIDIGFGDVITPKAMEIVYPTLLEFKEPVLQGYTPETAIAEKTQAMVDLDAANSRMKDFYDVWLLASRREFSGKVLAEAMRATFKRRGTPWPENIPVAFTTAFSDIPDKKEQWKAYLLKGRIQDEPPNFEKIIEFIASFILPIIAAPNDGSAFVGTWPPGGPWKE